MVQCSMKSDQAGIYFLLSKPAELLQQQIKWVGYALLKSYFLLNMILEYVIALQAYRIEIIFGFKPAVGLVPASFP
jgi:hypothetical protein